MYCPKLLAPAGVRPGRLVTNFRIIGLCENAYALRIILLKGSVGSAIPAPVMRAPLKNCRLLIAIGKPPFM
jgi:hypothetical protein